MEGVPTETGELGLGSCVLRGFQVDVRGGKWTKKNKQVADAVLEAFSESTLAKSWLEQYKLGAVFGCSLRKYGEYNAQMMC